MRKVTFALMAAMLLAAAPALAVGGEEGDVELGIFGGMSLYDDYGMTPPNNAPTYGIRLGYFFNPNFSLEGSYQTAGDELDHQAGFFAGRDFDIDSLRLNLVGHFREGRMFRPFLTGGIGMEMGDFEGLFDDDAFGLNVGGGLRWFVTDVFSIRLDGRAVNTDVGDAIRDDQLNMETTLGLSFNFGGAPPVDSDGDGVFDRKDDCPDTPRGAIVDERGCPTDADGDGVYDGIDQCPDTPQGWPVDAKGCPLDSDGDGVPDGKDRCPNTPRGATVDSDGCPSDSDGDGVFDGIDRCPNTPAGARVDRKGCPLDGDNDGVFDGLDKCPNTLAGCKVDSDGCALDEDGDGVCDGVDQCLGTPRGSTVDETGCVPTVRELDMGMVITFEGVYFDFDRSALRSEAFPKLAEVVRALEVRPSMVLAIDGHTDSVGKKSYNMKLGRRRAEVVRDYLVGKGVDPSRLQVSSYGESQPVASNDTEAGRQANRRVEIRRAN